MKFLFHTIIFFKDTPVYYTINKDKETYFAEVLENPNKITTAVNFTFQFKNGNWECSVALEEKQFQSLIEQLSLFP